MTFRCVVLLNEPIPLADMTNLVSALSPLLGSDAVMDAKLAARLGVRFAFRGADGPHAEDFSRPSDDA